MSLELWQVPLVVMLALTLGYFSYVAVASRWSLSARLWVKTIGLAALATVVLGVGYQLLKRAELSAMSTVLTVMMLGVEGFIGWVAWQQLKASRSRGRDG